MGPQGLTDTLPRGGRLYDEFPASRENYMDGLLQRHWASHKAEGCAIIEPEDMSRFVRQIVRQVGHGQDLINLFFV